jgi:hypothetical protein
MRTTETSKETQTPLRATNFRVNQKAFVAIKKGCGGAMSPSGALPFVQRLDAYPEMLLAAAPDAQSVSGIQSALDFFSQRYPTFVIALHDGKSLWLSTRRKDVSVPLRIDEPFENGVKWLRQYLASRIVDRFEAAQNWDNTWYDAFYRASYIPQRRNLRQFRQRISLSLFPKGSVEQRLYREVLRVKPNTTLARF